MDKLWLAKCFATAEKLYCVYPYEILEELYERGAKDDFDKGEALAYIDEVDFILMDYVDETHPAFEVLGYHEPGFFVPRIIDDKTQYKIYKEAADKGDAYALAHINAKEVECLINDQANTDFYIPTKEEIEKISLTGMNENIYYQELKKRIRKDVDANGFTKRIWQDFSSDVDYNTELTRIISILDLKTQNIDGQLALDISMEELNKINQMVVECYNHTNLRAKRGWEPRKLMDVLSELQPARSTPRVIVPMSEAAAEQTKETEEFLNSMGTKVDYDAGFGSYRTIVDGKVKRVKVGRNDPCPCGSGKKYKKCHGRGDSMPVPSVEDDDIGGIDIEKL